MLVKATNTTYPAMIPVPTTLVETIAQANESFSSSSKTMNKTWTSTLTWTVNLSFNWSVGGYWAGVTITNTYTIYKNNVAISSGKNASNITVNTGDVIKFEYQAKTNSVGSYQMYIWPCSIYKTKELVWLPKTWLKALPRNHKTLWNLWTWTLYWKHIDSIYYGWIMTWKGTTATTWSITLWNAKWYIRVNLNGEIVKIPYYWD